MWWLLLVLVVVTVAVVMMRRPEASTPPQAKPHPSQPSSLADIEGQMLREVEAEAARLMPQIEAEATKIHTDAMREAERVASEPWPDDDDEPDLAPHGIVSRRDFVPKEDEARYLTRDDDGVPTLRLVDAGDRLAIWSPVEGGALINPKGPGLRSLDLCASYARGSDHYRSAYRAVDLRKGQWIDLNREPENPHDKNAVAMCAPGSRVPFAYVQKGRAPAVARRMDAGEDLAALSMRGPRKGRDDDTTFVLIGSRADLKAMLDS